MRIPASVLKGIRTGLCGTTLALAALASTGCHKAAVDGGVTAEADEGWKPRETQASATDQGNGVEKAKPVEAPVASPFLVAGNTTQPTSFNGTQSVADPPDTQPSPNVATVAQPPPPPPKPLPPRPVAQNRPRNWPRIACACGRG